MCLTPSSIIQLLFIIYMKLQILIKILWRTIYLKMCNSPWVDVHLLYPKLLMLDLSHVDSDTLYLYLSFSFFLYLLFIFVFSNSPFHISSLVVEVSFWTFISFIFSQFIFSPFLTLMSKSLCSNRVFFHKGFVYFQYYPQISILVL